MLGRDESVARQQYSQQRLATKAQAILPHDSSNHAHTGKTQISGFARAEGHQDDEIQFVF